MANETTPSELGQGLVRENWGPRYISALYEGHSVAKYISNITGDFNRGDLANVPVEPVLTVNDTASDGSLTVQSVTFTNVQVAIDKKKDVTAELTGIARKQAEKKFEETFPISAGKAMRQQIESDILALYSDVTTTASGDGTGNLGEDEFLAAIQRMVTAKLPIIDEPGSFCFALADNQFAPVKKLNLLDYDRTGEAGKGGAASMGVPMLWNVPVVFSTQVATASSIRQSMLFSKDAFAWAAQRNVEPRFADRLAAAKDSYLMTVLGLYGVKTVTAGRANVLKSKA